MTIQYTDAKTHWIYFLALERDFETVCRYIEPCEENNDTFSLELARVIMAATQEADVVLKAICNRHLNVTADKLHGYFPPIRSQLPQLLTDSVRLPRFGMSSTPWQNWTQCSAPAWWTANNKIKHQRHTHFNRASFRHAFNAVGGLLLAIAHYEFHTVSASISTNDNPWWATTDSLAPQSTMFRIDEDRYRLQMKVGSVAW